MNTSWGTKRNCPSCTSHFYDLNKMPATCPKCHHQFDPTATQTKGRRKSKREAPEEAPVAFGANAFTAKKAVTPKKEKKRVDEDELEDDGMDMVEIEEDTDNLQDLSELEEMEEKPLNEDDADDEVLLEETNTGANTLVGNIEDEEAEALFQAIEDEEQSDKIKSKKSK